MKPLIVKLPHHEYPIIWENDLDKLEKLIKEKTKTGKHFVVTNNTIFSYYKDIIQQLFGDSPVLQIDDGESYKNFTTITNLADELLQKGANRSSTLWAFGGGVVGDITGFLASIYMRGIRFYQIPTTLLSMVDSSVGGKTGVNLDHGKNMIGTFHQPDGVFIHVNFLKTLHESEFKSGLSEVIKSGLLGDPELFQFIENNIDKINQHLTEVQNNPGRDLNIDQALMEELSFRSVTVKANIVMEDEKETGLRAILNLGHTLAHAIESLYGYTKMITHGHAVALGIIYAANLSLEKGLLKEEDFKRIEQLFVKFKMKNKPIGQPPGLIQHGQRAMKEEFLGLIERMRGDKKNIDESIRFILLKGIGETSLPEPVDIPIIEKTLNIFWGNLKCL